MVAPERHAVFNAAVTLSSLLLFTGLIPVLGPARAQAAFGLLGLTALGRFFYRKRKAQILTDERDRLINLRAIQIGFAVFWILFSQGIVIAWFVKHTDGMISVDVLPFMAFAGWAVFLLVHSVTMLALYRRS